MTCKDYIINKFGQEVGEKIIKNVCPDTFGFEDDYDACGDCDGCEKCWSSEQYLPNTFHEQCENFDVSMIDMVDEFIERTKLNNVSEPVTRKEHIMNKFGQEKGTYIINNHCPSSFGFDDYKGLCSEAYACESCWNAEQELPSDFDILCEKFLSDIGVNTKMVRLTEDAEPKIQDSGDRTEFETGAVRDRRAGKGRCDLMPLDIVADLMPNSNAREILHNIYDFQETGNVECLRHCLLIFSEFYHYDYESCMPRMCHMLLEVAKHFEEGCAKYGENNWRKGIPVYCYIDSAVRHYLKHLRGDTDERHDRAFCWNIMCCIWTVEHSNLEEEEK